MRQGPPGGSPRTAGLHVSSHAPQRSLRQPSEVWIPWMCERESQAFSPPLCYFSMTPLQGQGSLHNMDLGILGATLAVGPAAPRGDWPSPAVAGPGLQDGPAMWGLQKGRQLSLSHPVSFPASPPGLGSADGARMEQEAIGVLVQSERQRARRGAIPHRQQRTQP